MSLGGESAANRPDIRNLGSVDPKAFDSAETEPVSFDLKSFSNCFAGETSLLKDRRAS